MLTGRFGNTTGRPYIEGRVSFPRIGRAGNISFLVDSGADRSIIMPGDAIRIQIDYAQLGGSVPTTGIGGVSNQFEEHGVIAFSEPGKRVYVYSLDILLPSPSPDLQAIPSLVGRDILSRWRMVMDRDRGNLTFTVRSADDSFTI